MPLIRPIVLAALSVLAPGSAAQAGCSVEVSAVAFGNIDIMRASRGTGEVVVRCDEASDFSVGLSPGGGGGGGERRMRGPGGAWLDYYLMADAGYSIPWGDGQAIGNPRAGRSNGAAPARLTIYGIIPSQPGTPEGQYTDSLVVTLTF
jgi:spore coat protein U-like protein